MMKKLFKTIYYMWYSIQYMLYNLFSGGKFLRTKEEADERMKICRACDRINTVLGKFEMCDECNCYMPLKTKINSTACPLEEPKWTQQSLITNPK